ncbi:glycosyltransferase [Pseudomonas kribbensis]|uniref:glycosyltransferase n=1 Tax=Pseudomonas kribbensis TaxID=1628086 RepID=UPI003D771472
MSFSKINFWIEGDISTTRIVSRLLNDVSGEGNCDTRLLSTVGWSSLVSGVNIFCRSCDPRYAWLPTYLREHGIPYAYYLDDNFWKITGSGELARYYKSAEVVMSLDAFVENASFVITHNKTFAEFINRRFPDVKCELLPVPFDTSLIRKIAKKLAVKPARDAVVGYAGGYKEEEFSLLQEVVEQLGKERPEIRFEFIGGVSDELRSLNNVQWFPGFSDYSQFLEFKMARNWSVGLAPLMESQFNASKTNNKFREYGGCGISAIYSNTTPYVECVVSERSGLLVDNNVADWVEAIKRLVDNPQLRETIKEESFKYVELNHSHESIIPAWREALDRISHDSERLMSSRIRFNYVKHFHLSGMSRVAKRMEGATATSIYGFVLKGKLKSLLNRAPVRKLIKACAFVALIAAGLYLLKAGIM